jgi:hypothetical protein
MRLPIALACALVAASVAPARADVEVTSTIDFAMGTVSAAPIRGFVAPGLHLDVGLGNERLRVQAMLDDGLWTEQLAGNKDGPDGTFTRYGAGLRFVAMDLHAGARGARRGLNAMRVYVEADAGREALAGAVVLARPDVGVGFGVVQAVRLGGAILGGHFAVRALVAPPIDGTSARVACRGACSPPTGAQHADLGLFFLLGFSVGR